MQTFYGKEWYLKHITNAYHFLSSNFKSKEYTNSKVRAHQIEHVERMAFSTCNTFFLAKKLTFESMNRLCEHLRIQITVILEEYTGCLAYFGMHLLMAFYRWFAQIHPSIHEPLSSARRLCACKLSLLAQLTTDQTTLFPNGTLFRKIRFF